jgi:hypothetical protein
MNLLAIPATTGDCKDIKGLAAVDCVKIVVNELKGLVNREL